MRMLPLVRYGLAAAGLGIGAFLLAAVIRALLHPVDGASGSRATSVSAPKVASEARGGSGAVVGARWRYGRADARFVLTEYADLECPFCRAYFPALKRWIDEHPDVAWEWQHLPLPMHEPVASAEARLAECVGQASGGAGFWQAVEWIYAHTRGDGQGLPAGLNYPDLTSQANSCVESSRPDAVIRAQAEEAARLGVAATPTLRLQDRQSKRALLLSGLVEGDALLSALDSLEVEPGDGSPLKEMPADVVGDMPR